MLLSVKLFDYTYAYRQYQEDNTDDSYLWSPVITDNLNFMQDIIFRVFSHEQSRGNNFVGGYLQQYARTVTPLALRAYTRYTEA